MSRKLWRLPSYDTIASLDADIADSVTFIIKNGDFTQEFTIDKKIAKQCQTLETVMANDAEEKVYPIIGIQPELFQLVTIILFIFIRPLII